MLPGLLPAEGGKSYSLGSSIYLLLDAGAQGDPCSPTNPGVGESACVALICAVPWGQTWNFPSPPDLVSRKPVKMASGVTLKGKEEGDPEVSKVL